MGYDDIKYFIDKFYPDMPERTRDNIKADMLEMREHNLALKGDAYMDREARYGDGEGDSEQDKPEGGDSTEADGEDMDEDARDIAEPRERR